jgi:hypothetical protein
VALSLCPGVGLAGKRSTGHAQVGSADAGPRRLGLLIGVSSYDRGSKEKDKDWWDLHSRADVEALKQVLVRRFQFAEEDVKTLTTKEETTHAAIISTFRSFLTARARKGDVIFIHYSGHGQPVPDDDRHGPNPSVGDEIDGYDETLVPSDYVSQKDGSKNIRDDEVGLLLEELAVKQPANVTVSIDSCFSGTATRGELLPRGGAWKGDPVAPAKVRGEELSPSGLATHSAVLSAGHVYLAAAGPRQSAREFYNEDGQPMGLYTHALVKALEAAGPATTYRDLFERVTDVITRQQRDQTPQLEGQMDLRLMDGSALPQQRYVVVRPDTRGNVYLQAGKLQGLTKGSRFALYPAGAKEPTGAVKLADAEIVELNVTRALLRLDRRVDPDQLAAARAFETEHFYEESLLKVVTEGIDGLPGGAEALAQVRGLGAAESVGRGLKGWDVLIRQPTGEDVANRIVPPDFRGVLLGRPDGSIIAYASAGPDMAEHVRTALEAEARWKVVKSLENTDPRVSIELRVVPVEVRLNESGYVTEVLRDKPGGVRLTSGGNIVLEEGDYIMLEVRNVGTEPAYVTVLDLRPDGKIGPLWPHPREPGDNYVPNDGRWQRVKEPFVFRIELPPGLENFKAIATREPTDFSPLLDPDLAVRGPDQESERGRNAARSPLGRILQSAQQGKRAGLNMEPPMAWATASVTFTVRKVSPATRSAWAKPRRKVCRCTNP